MKAKPHVCPVWAGYFLISPLRKLRQNPMKILSPHISQGMNILEIGPAMGFFSIPMAKMTGTAGKVYCVDIQERMLKKLGLLAIKKGVEQIIETRKSTDSSLQIEDLKNAIDFVLLAYVAHEIPDQGAMFAAVAETMKSNSTLLLIEPKGHVSEDKWEKSLSTAREKGLELRQEIKVSGSRGALFRKS